MLLAVCALRLVRVRLLLLEGGKGRGAAHAAGPVASWVLAARSARVVQYIGWWPTELSGGVAVLSDGSVPNRAPSVALAR